MFNQQQISLFGQIQTSQSGDQLYSDAALYKVKDYSLAWPTRKYSIEIILDTCSVRPEKNRQMSIRVAQK